MKSKKEKLDTYFIKGLKLYNQRKFYAAHEYWEEMWTNFYFNDRIFVQGLIQASVGYFHITNINLNGARGLFKKCLPKLKKFEATNIRIDNLVELIHCVENAKKCVDEIEDVNDFNWDNFVELRLKVIEE